MDLLIERVAGLDVHRDQVTACVRTPNATGRGRGSETRTWATTTAELTAMATWLSSQEVTHVAMEATGVYWRPVFAALERDFELLLVNAAHMKNVPGRKTDVADAAWIAQLLEHGLLRASFVPPPEFRRLRNLVRYRKTLVSDRVRIIQRIEKTLQDAGVKLTSVASQVLTLSGRAMLEAIIGGERDPKRLAGLARGRLRPRMTQLAAALDAHIEDQHVVMVRNGLAHLDVVDRAIAEVSSAIDEICRPHEWALDLLDTIPGVSRRNAQMIIAEIGVDMSVFPTAGHLASWAGMCPGNNKSAGRTGPGTCRPGSPWLREALVEAAQAAGRTRNTYVAVRHARVRARRGKARAAIATGHFILVACWYMLSRRESFNELGVDYYTQRHSPTSETRRLVRKLEALGNRVTIEPAA
jgi:transposase